MLCRVENNIIIAPQVDLPDGDYYLLIKPVNSRSAKQNNYYWKVVNTLGQELGYTKNQMHKTLKEEFRIESTKELSTSEFSDYIEQIIYWAATELNIVLPSPEMPK